jgi:signal transduction histidine kinase
VSSINAKTNRDVEKLKAELERKEVQLHAIQKIGIALSSVLNQEQLLILIMDQVTKLMNAERSTLYIVDNEKGEIWSKIAQKAEIKEIRQKIGVGISGYVAKRGEEINIKDAYRDNRFDPTTDKKTGYHTKSILCMPIREPVKDEKKIGEIIAVIQILNSKRGYFNVEDEELLRSLASQIAISLVNSRLYSILEERVNELNLLFNIEKVISNAENLEDMLRNLIKLIADSLNTEMGMLLIYDQQKKQFPFRFAHNMDEKKIKEASFSADVGIVGQVLTRGKIYISNDLTNDKYFNKVQAKFLDIKIRQLLCAPLISEKSVIGVFELMNKMGEHSYFSSHDEKMLESIASHIALGIENFRLKEENIKAERLAAIGNMMSAIVHDLRTPINNIYGFVDLMNEEVDQKVRGDYASIINEQIKILTNMSTDILDFAKGKTTILPRKYPVDKLVKEFIRLFEAEIKRQGFNFIYDINAAGMIYIDPEKINRVFMNIMKNSLEAMSKGGTFSISAEEVNGEIVFHLRDTGKGIPEEIRDKLFDSFVTSGKKGGTGLGLAIVKKVIDEHKARIEVESVQGAGTTFKIYFPKV